MKKLRLLILAFATFCFIGFYGCKGGADKAEEVEGEAIEAVEEAVEVMEEIVDTTEAAEETPAEAVEEAAEEEKGNE